MFYVSKPTTKKDRREYEEWLEKNKVTKPTQAELDKDRNSFFAKQAALRISRDRTSHIPSHDTPGGSTSTAAPSIYTGIAILGVSVMHKSNAVPVFSKKEAIEIAKMRRG